jgi:hypothetical protein
VVGVGRREMSQRREDAALALALALALAPARPQRERRNVVVEQEKPAARQLGIGLTRACACQVPPTWATLLHQENDKQRGAKMQTSVIAGSQTNNGCLLCRFLSFQYAQSKVFV